MDDCVDDILDIHAINHSEMPAVCSLGSELIYKGLEALVTKLVSHWVALRVRKTAIVPVLFEKSIWTVVVFVAILMTGGSFVLLDINQP